MKVDTFSVIYILEGFLLKYNCISAYLQFYLLLSINSELYNPNKIVIETQTFSFRLLSVLVLYPTCRSAIQ